MILELTDLTGPAGKMLELMDRHPFRPAHIHIIVSPRHFFASNLRTDSANYYIGYL